MQSHGQKDIRGVGLFLPPKNAVSLKNFCRQRFQLWVPARFCSACRPLQHCTPLPGRIPPFAASADATHVFSPFDHKQLFGEKLSCPVLPVTTVRRTPSVEPRRLVGTTTCKMKARIRNSWRRPNRCSFGGATPKRGQKHALNKGRRW